MTLATIVYKFSKNICQRKPNCAENFNERNSEMGSAHTSMHFLVNHWRFLYSRLRRVKLWNARCVLSWGDFQYYYNSREVDTRVSSMKRISHAACVCHAHLLRVPFGLSYECIVGQSSLVVHLFSSFPTRSSKMALAYELIDFKNPVFQAYAFWNLALALKILFLSIFTSMFRMKNQVRWNSAFQIVLQLTFNARVCSQVFANPEDGGPRRVIFNNEDVERVRR